MAHNSEKYERDESGNRFLLVNQENENATSNPRLTVPASDMIDPVFNRRCYYFMRGFACDKGDYCDRIHKLPRDDNIICRDFAEDACERTAKNCWFRHPNKRYKRYTTPQNAPKLVQPMAEVFKMLKQNPKKYS